MAIHWFIFKKSGQKSACGK